MIKPKQSSIGMPLVCWMLLLISGCNKTLFLDLTGTDAGDTETSSELATEPDTRITHLSPMEIFAGACFNVSDCFGGYISECLEYLPLIYEDIDDWFIDISELRCLATAKNCDASAKCCQQGFDEDPCESGERAAFCDQDIVYECAYPETSEEEHFLLFKGPNCTAVTGGKCVETKYDAHCEFDTDLCQGEEMTKCIENTAVYCSEGDALPWTIVDCDAIGKTCYPDNGCGDIDSPICTGDVCEGPFLKECLGNRFDTFDCRLLDPDFVCIPETEYPDTTCGLPPEKTECDDEQDGECIQNTAVVCVGGKKVSVDCSKRRPGATCNAVNGIVECVTE